MLNCDEIMGCCLEVEFTHVPWCRVVSEHDGLVLLYMVVCSLVRRYWGKLRYGVCFDVFFTHLFEGQRLNKHRGNKQPAGAAPPGMLSGGCGGRIGLDHGCDLKDFAKPVTK